MKINPVNYNANQSFTSKLSPVEKEINREVKNFYKVILDHKRKSINLINLKNKLANNDLLKDVLVKNDKYMDSDICAYVEPSAFDYNTRKFKFLSLNIRTDENKKTFAKTFRLNFDNVNTLMHEITHLFQFKKNIAGNESLNYFYKKFGPKKVEGYSNKMEDYCSSLILSVDKFNSEKFTSKLQKAIKLNHKMTKEDEIYALKYYLDVLLMEKNAYKNGLKYQVKYAIKKIPLKIKNIKEEIFNLKYEKECNSSFNFNKKEKILRNEIKKRLV